MACFYFDVTDDGTDNASDVIGTEMERADIPEVAVTMIAGIAADRLLDGLHRTFAVSVRDNEGDVVLTAQLSIVAAWTTDPGWGETS